MHFSEKENKTKPNTEPEFILVIFRMVENVGYIHNI